MNSNYRGMLDLLSDILSRLDIRGTLYFRSRFTPPWGLEVPSFENVARFHFVARGVCHVRVAGSDEVLTLEQGDLVIIPHGASHQLLSERGAGQDILPLDQVVSESGYTGVGVFVHGGDEEDRPTELICGHISYQNPMRHPMFERLPASIEIRDYGSAAGAWMEATLRAIADESQSVRPGGDLIALKMTEALFAQSIRIFLEDQAADTDGLAGFVDPQIARALGAFHKSPAYPWTVEDLAREAGLSRTGFAEQFATKMKMTPIQYVTSWRMQIARKALAQDRRSVGDIAAMAGYASESAFIRAFKNDSGLTPTAYRRAHPTDRR